MRYVVLDTETTGLDPKQGHRVIEIGCVELEGRRLTGRTLHHYLNPQRPVDPGALAVHGLSDDFLADKPLFSSIAEEFLAFVQGAELIIHNAPFDVGFLNAELGLLAKEPLPAYVEKITDSLLMAREQFPGKRNSLDALCDRLEVNRQQRTFHGALLDAQLLADVYLMMTRGQESLRFDLDFGDDIDGKQASRRPLSSFNLPVAEVDPETVQIHQAYLEGMRKEAKAGVIWLSPVQGEQ